MDARECDLLDVKFYAKYKDNHRDILSLTDVFSTFLHTILVKTKGGPSVSSGFRSIFDDQKYSSQRRSTWVRTDKGKEFLNKYFQVVLRDEGGLQFQVCRIPDLKCAVVERGHPTFAIESTNILHITLHTYISMFCRSLSGPKMTQFTRRLAWRPRES